MNKCDGENKYETKKTPAMECMALSQLVYFLLVVLPIPCPHSQFPLNQIQLHIIKLNSFLFKLTASPLELIVHVDESWGSERRSRNSIGVGKVVSDSQGSNRQAEHDVFLEGEGSLESDLAAVPLEVLDGHADGEQLAAEVGDEKAGAVAVAVLGGGLDGAKIGAEVENLILWLGGQGNALTLDLELGEDGDTESVDVVWARAWDNKIVVDK